jgi:hypothetical protein
VSEITFASSIDIPYEIMYTDFLLSYPKCMILSDDYLIIQDDRGHDFYFHAINRISGELAMEYGRKGIGPGEILYASANPVFNCLEN